MPKSKKRPYSLTFTYDEKTRDAMEILMSRSINLADFCRRSILSFAEQIKATEKLNK
jgi:hypothetical protein